MSSLQDSTRTSANASNGDLGSSSQKTPRDAKPALTRPAIGRRVSRILTKIGIHAKALTDKAAAGNPSDILTSRSEKRSSPTGVKRSQAFADLAGYSSILKTRAIAERFDFDNPFYRSHDKNKGTATWIEGRRFVNFASYNYLGLNGHPAVAEAAKNAIDEYGTSVSASRIVAGEIPLHAELERALADVYQTQSALVFVSGHATNVFTIGTLLDSDDLVIYDELAHNSLIVGARLSGAHSFAFRHNDLDALEQLLNRERPRHRNVLIAVEGLYSMDGDTPDLPRLIELKKRFGTWLMVDEAHALGVLGQRGLGSSEHWNIDPLDVDIWMGTLSKTLAGCGGFIAGNHELIEILKYRAAGMVYSVGMSPPLAAAALAALKLMRAEPERVEKLRSNGHLFLRQAKSHGLDTLSSEGYAVVPVMVGDIIKAGRVTDLMYQHGINALPIIYPAVPLKAARLRFFITSDHTREELVTAAQQLCAASGT
jgi:8-amino-7-oxononanoate synthase